MTNNQRVLGLIGLCRRAGKLIFGSEACLEAVERKKVKLILVAEDAASKTKENFIYFCEKNKIPIVQFGRIDEISKAIGKDNKAVIGIKEKNLADEIVKIINGGDIIG